MNISHETFDKNTEMPEPQHAFDVATLKTEKVAGDNFDLVGLTVRRVFSCHTWLIRT
jgi:hypothetical protein